MASSSGPALNQELQCSIGLGVFTDPVTTPCGHKLVQHFKKLNQESEVFCDICAERKQKAVKSCLTCQSSYCDSHLEPHLRVPRLKKHTLINAVENLEDYICQKHERPLEMFCRDDQTCVCLSCTEGDHRTHNTVPIEEEIREKKTLTSSDGFLTSSPTVHISNGMIIGLGVLLVAVLIILPTQYTTLISNDSFLTSSPTVHISTWMVIGLGVLLMVALIILLKQYTRCQYDLKMMEEKQKAAEKKAEDLDKELKQEITELKRKNTELQMMEKQQKAAEKQAEDLNKELKRRNTEFKMMEEQHKAAEKQAEDLNKELKQEITELKRRNTELQMMEKQQKAAEKQAEDLNKELKRRNTEFKMMEEQHKAAEKQAEDLNKELKQEITELKRRNTELQMMEKQQKAAEKQAEDLNKELKRRNTEFKMMEEQHKAAEKQAEDLNKELKQEITELKRKNTELQMMEKQQKAAEKQAEDLNKELKQEITELKRRNTELQMMEKQQKAAEKQAEDLNIELKRRNTEFKMMEEQHKAAEKQAEDLNKELKQEITELKRKNTELQMMEKQQKAAEKQAEDLNKELKRRNTELKMMKEQQKAAEKQAEDLNKELKQEITEMCSFMNTLSHNKNWTEINSDSDVNSLKRVLTELKKLLKEELIELKFVQKFAVDVTLDPDTAYPFIILSDDGKQVSDGDIKQNVPENPKRFDTCSSVLAKQGFRSGRFYYEVQVKGKTDWELGVARESINRKEMIILTPENGYWTVWLMNDNQYEAGESTRVSLSLRVKPEKVGVFVDYEEGLVSFYDVDSRSHIYSFTGQTFTDKLYPYFNPCDNDKGKNSNPLIITPVN